MDISELIPFLPINSGGNLSKLIAPYKLIVTITKDRNTKLGDYRFVRNDFHQITINGGLNPYQFLITLVHEISHMIAFVKYGIYIKPHGKEWKFIFKHAMLPFLTLDVFPDDILRVLSLHMKNPKASSSSDEHLVRILRSYNDSNSITVSDIPFNTRFTHNGKRVFIKKEKKVKRYLCLEESTNKLYLFNPNAEIQTLD